MPTVRRTTHRLSPDPRRVLAKPYLPGEEITPGGDSRSAGLMRRVLNIPEEQVARLVAEILRDFSGRHQQFEELLERHCELVIHHVPAGQPPSAARRLLIGAYFTNEYSVEGAALCNPSLVLAPDQVGCRPGDARFIMSVRGVGEGHISSIGFRTGVLHDDGELSFDAATGCLVSGERAEPTWYGRHLFRTKLAEIGAGDEWTDRVLAELPERFTRAQLEQALAGYTDGGAARHETVKVIRMLAASSYITRFPAASAITQRVIFPAGPHETRGMEDARFVRFTEDDGAVRYYATYTAFDGWDIIPQFIETQDFGTFAISTLHGSAAQNKGMALFPRRVGGKYLMLSRKDRENLYLASSDDLRSWNDSRPLYGPASPWELLQIGNCGSPLETEQGWLVLTHGVGPMRTYAMGALLLDRDQPGEVIGHLRAPLLFPDASEREGYVPNVVYSCGGMISGERLVIPYGVSDREIAVAVVSLPELLAELRRAPAANLPPD
jgi:predicted GH43/DUF377 family glycosyl hydrolase